MLFYAEDHRHVSKAVNVIYFKHVSKLIKYFIYKSKFSDKVIILNSKLIPKSALQPSQSSLKTAFKSQSSPL